MKIKLKIVGTIALLMIAAISLAGVTAATAASLPTQPSAAGPTPEPQPTGPELKGHVIWEGRPAQPSTLQELPLNLTLTQVDVDPGLAFTYEVKATNPDGTFVVQLGDIPKGMYEWRTKGPTFLSRSGIVSIKGDPGISVDMGLQKAGDLNGDNVVNARDYNLLRLTFGKSEGELGYDSRADLNGDTVVNSTDFVLLTRNMGLGGS